MAALNAQLAHIRAIRQSLGRFFVALSVFSPLATMPIIALLKMNFLIRVLRPTTLPGSRPKAAKILTV